jgi:hypothetical protein
MKQQKRTFTFSRPEWAIPVPIVGDAAISARGVHGGRLIPLLLLDTSARPDLAEFIRNHRSLGAGDVDFYWGRRDNHEGTIALFLEFIRPLEFVAILEFEIVRQGILVEQALSGQGIYLAISEGPNDRLSDNIDRPKVILDLPDTGVRLQWDEIFLKHLTRHLREQGLARRDAKTAAISAIRKLKEFSSFRTPDV